ncbi:MAG: type IV toxin-antitoxin system AbiEi family antitoxin domain-containing protein, partial [Actinomycetota bacterium]
MALIHAPIAELAARRHGVVLADEFEMHGVSTDARRRLARAGAIVSVHRGVYRLASAPDTFEAKCAAACVGSAAVVTGLAAASLWGFRHARRPDLPSVLLPHDSNSLASGAIVRRTNVLDPEDVVERPDGIRIASPPRTWFDCARDVGDDTFEAMTEWVIDRHSSVPALWRVVRRLACRGRQGSGRVRRVMSQRDDWQRPAGSKLELRVLRSLEDRSVAELVRQFPIRLENGIVVHPDGADPAVRWAVEIDHVTWHGGRLDAQRDKQRDRWLLEIDWTLE